MSIKIPFIINFSIGTCQKEGTHIFLYDSSYIKYSLMITSKRDTSNIFKGCLAYLKNELTTELPEGQNFSQSIGIKGLVGSETYYDVYNTPYGKSPVYFEIYFGNKFIYPTAYSLMGRRVPTWKHNFLKSWNFFGKDEKGKWDLLSSYKNNQFDFEEIKTFPLFTYKSYNGFKIEMTDADSDGVWVLCLGQIEVFGDIYLKPHRNINCNKYTVHLLKSGVKPILTLIIIQIVK